MWQMEVLKCPETVQNRNVSWYSRKTFGLPFCKLNLLKPFESTCDQYDQKTMNYIGAVQNIQSAMELQPEVTGAARCLKDISGKLR